MRRLLRPRRRNWPTRYVLEKHLGNHADAPDKSEIAHKQLEPRFLVSGDGLCNVTHEAVRSTDLFGNWILRFS